MKNLADNTASSIFTQKFMSTDHVDTAFVLESTRLGIDSENGFCKQIRFGPISFKNGATEIYPNLQKHIDTTAKSQWPMLDVIITRDSTTGKVTQVDLQTPRGV
jgi:hypothetical protein